MSHIHIPDGVLPLWLVAAGWLITAVILAIAVRRISAEDWARRLPLLAVVAALMIVGMTVELVPIGYHLNMSVVAGIILGPAFGFIAAFLVNVILAMFGHGGVTVIGLNSLVIGAEAVAGYFFFRAMLALLSPRRAAWAAAVAVILALFLSTMLMIGVVAVANVNAAAPGVPDYGAISFGNPFGGGVVSWELLSGEQAHPQVLDVGTFARIVLTLGLIGWLIEATISALIVRYVMRTRPAIILGESRPPLQGGGLAPGE